MEGDRCRLQTTWQGTQQLAAQTQLPRWRKQLLQEEHNHNNTLRRRMSSCKPFPATQVLYTAAHQNPHRTCRVEPYHECLGVPQHLEAGRAEAALKKGSSGGCTKHDW